MQTKKIVLNIKQIVGYLRNFLCQVSIHLPLQLDASVGSLKQALTTSRSDVIVEHVEPSHLSAKTNGRVEGPPYVAEIDYFYIKQMAHHVLLEKI